MRFCFCNILYSKKNDSGGLGSHIQDLSQEFAKRGHEVTILTSGEKKEYFEGPVKIVQLAKVARYSGAFQLLDPLYWFQRLYYMWKLAAYARQNRFDLIEAAEGGAEQLFLVLLSPCPVVTKLHGNFRHIYNHGILASVIAFFERFVVSKGDGVYTSSLAYAKTIASEYNMPPEKIRIIPYGISIHDLYDHQRNEDNSGSKDRAEKGTKTVLLSVGSSPVRKGARLFLEAASELSDENIQFLLLCSDESFQSQVKIPNNVTFLGNLDRNRFYSVLSQADIVVFPSQFESFGIAAYEAMLLGKIVIVSKNVPLEGSAGNYERYVVMKALTSIALAGAILDIFTGKIKLPQLSPITLKRMKNEYDISNIATSTLDYYQEILGSRSTRFHAVAEKIRGLNL